eukprot:2611993-Prorocentrum_lima.AAC.1
MNANLMLASAHQPRLVRHRCIVSTAEDSPTAVRCEDAARATTEKAETDMPSLARVRTVSTIPLRGTWNSYHSAHRRSRDRNAMAGGGSGGHQGTGQGGELPD